MMSRNTESILKSANAMSAYYASDSSSSSSDESDRLDYGGGHDPDAGKSDSSTSGTGNTSKMAPDRDELKEIKRIAQRESRDVRAWKMISLVVLLASTVAVTWIAYVLLSRMDRNDFERTFHEYVNTIEQTPNAKVSSLVKRVHGLARVLSAHAQTSNQKWPFVGLPDFEAYAKQVHGPVHNGVVLFAPFVPRELLKEWASYVKSSKTQYYASAEGVADDVFTVTYDDQGQEVIDSASISTSSYPAGPLWQVSPLPVNKSVINYDTLNSTEQQSLFEVITSARVYAIGQVNGFEPQEFMNSISRYEDVSNIQDDAGFGFSDRRPHSTLAYPIFEDAKNETSEIVGMVLATIPWDDYMQNLLSEGDDEVNIVLHNTCNQSFTYSTHASKAVFVGPGDQHDAAFTHMGFTIPLSTFPNLEGIPQGHCEYSITVYPTNAMYGEFDDMVPVYFASVVGLSVFLIVFIFIKYNSFVEVKHEKIANAAARSGAIVSSFFPSHFRDQIVGANDKLVSASSNQKKISSTGKQELSKFLASEMDDGDLAEGQAIADFYPETTIMFADMVGFTAWSSVREPTEVFVLLETVYSAFDQIARRRRVFKVETVGDCYVAVAGLPDPRKDHAIVMARFAQNCMSRMSDLTKALEATLGPDTGDLCLRIGLHSGPVTAGILRGDGARFQLFGDAMNVASRMESMGKPARIHLSKETADILTSMGKASWIEMRQDKVVAKGKGEIETFWLVRGQGRALSSHSSSDSNESELGIDQAIQNAVAAHEDEEKTKRLIEWNSSILVQLVEQIASARNSSNQGQSNIVKSPCHEMDSGVEVDLECKESRNHAKSILDEIDGVIPMGPHATRPTASQTDGPSTVAEGGLTPDVLSQIHRLVEQIAALHNPRNAYHNFEHASHVVMTITQMLHRIVVAAPARSQKAGKGKSENQQVSYAKILKSDPLMHLACVLACLSYQINYPGISPSEFTIASDVTVEKKRLLSEEKAFHIVWNLVFSEESLEFGELRKTLFGHSQSEQERFRKAFLHAIMATNTSDPLLKQLYECRWQAAFVNNHDNEPPPTQTNSGTDAMQITTALQLTVVLELLVRASSTSHALQHWKIFKKWALCYFSEALQNSRADASSGEAATTTADVDTFEALFHQFQISYLDDIVLPLANKLKDACVFGGSRSSSSRAEDARSSSSSLCAINEYLGYANANRTDWAMGGRDILQHYIKKAKAR